MAKTKQQIATILKKAIKGEEDGYFFYNLLAKRATNAAARRKLEGLRDDEIRHKETLYKLYYKHVGGEIGRLPAKGINALAQVFKKGHLMELRSEMEYLNLAIEAELAATKYYREERELVDDAKFQKLFDKLSEEEHGHFELLQAEKDAISGNYHWFSIGTGAEMED
jgi:rubrerythrin